jgi:hypothetical protein
MAVEKSFDKTLQLYKENTDNMVSSVNDGKNFVHSAKSVYKKSYSLTS